MFRTTGAAERPTWTRIEDDFMLGACAHRLFGYISRSAKGLWATFGIEADLQGEFEHLSDAQHALWSTHLTVHQDKCASRTTWWSRIFLAFTHDRLLGWRDRTFS